ncbi:ABC transporter substrate-binding protein [Promicromonospora soli]
MQLRKATSTFSRRGTVAALAALTLSLTACSTGGLSEGSAEGGGEGGPTPILVWSGVKGEAEIKLGELVEQYNASQDDYVVETQFSGTGDRLPAKLLSAVQNDQGPNMQLGDSTPQMLAQLLETGKVVPLDDLIDDPEAEVGRDNFTEGMLATGTFDGTVYSLPTEAGDYSLVYNKEMFDEAGLEVPTTWDEVADAAEALTTDDRYGIYLPIGTGEWPVFTWQTMLWSAGGELLNEDMTEVAFDSPEGVTALKTWTDLIEDGVAYPSSLQTDADGQGIASLQTGQVGMVITGAYNLGILDEALGAENVGVATFPQIEEPAMNTGTNNSYILEGTDEEEAGAWDFLQYWLSPEVQAEWCIASGYLPTNIETAQSETFTDFLQEDPRQQVFYDQLEYAEARPSILAYSGISAALSTEIEKALLGRTTPEEALQAAAKNAQAALDEQQ